MWDKKKFEEKRQRGIVLMPFLFMGTQWPKFNNLENEFLVLW